MNLYVKNISKAYSKKKVVHNFSMTMQRGEAVALLGPNGAGKTTCFSIIAGLVKLDSGEIFIGDKDITHVPIYHRSYYGIGYLPQESSIFRGLNVYDNIMCILEHVESDYSKRQSKIEELLGEFGISHLKHASAAELSGGERRRLEIARSLALNPKFMLLDEPLAGIDPIAIADIKNLISRLKQRNIGILITDHNVRETLDIVDKAYVIFEGKELFCGTPKEVARSKIVKNVYLGESLKDEYQQ